MSMIQRRGYAQVLHQLGYVKQAQMMSPEGDFSESIEKDAGVFGTIGKGVSKAWNAAGDFFRGGPKKMFDPQNSAKSMGSVDDMFAGASKPKMAPPTKAESRGADRAFSSPVKPPPPASASAPAGAPPTGAPSATKPAAGPGMLGWMKKHPIVSSIGGTGIGFGAGTVMGAGVQQPMGSPQQMYQQQQQQQ